MKSINAHILWHQAAIRRATDPVPADASSSAVRPTGGSKAVANPRGSLAEQVQYIREAFGVDGTPGQVIQAAMEEVKPKVTADAGLKEKAKAIIDEWLGG